VHCLALSDPKAGYPSQTQSLGTPAQEFLLYQPVAIFGPPYEGLPLNIAESDRCNSVYRRP
jgi:hypothetical protein